MARYEVAVFSFLFLGLFSFLGRVGVTPRVRLKSCQSCVSALRHSQNVCFLATGRHDCLKHFISMSSCVNNSKIKNSIYISVRLELQYRVVHVLEDVRM